MNISAMTLPTPSLSFDALVIYFSVCALISPSAEDNDAFSLLFSENRSHLLEFPLPEQSAMEVLEGQAILRWPQLVQAVLSRAENHEPVPTTTTTTPNSASARLLPLPSGFPCPPQSPQTELPPEVICAGMRSEF